MIYLGFCGRTGETIVNEVALAQHEKLRYVADDFSQTKIGILIRGLLDHLAIVFQHEGGAGEIEVGNRLKLSHGGGTVKALADVPRQMV